MSPLTLFSDEARVADAVARRLPDVSWQRAPAPADRSAGTALAVRRAPGSGPPTATGADAELLVAAMRAVGLDARLGPPTPAAVSAIALPPADEQDGERVAGVAAAVHRWWRARGDRSVLLSSPRSACAGVDRAIEIVRLTLARFGAPVHVRKQIVHNEHVVAELAALGAVFVDSVDEVPPGSVLVYSAHGVSPAVRAAARTRGLVTVDATCPLVAKVHSEARQHARAGRAIAYIGHAGHEESEGTIGEAPSAIQVVETVADVDRLDTGDDREVAFLTQTTLATDEVEEIVGALRRRYPQARGPRGEDICYATTNRQRAVRATAARVDLVLVVGSATSSNAQRLVEVAARSGAPAVLVEDATGIDPALLLGVARIGVTAAASTPEQIVTGVVRALGRLGRLDVDEVRVAEEDIAFTLPAALRGTRAPDGATGGQEGRA